MMKKIDTASKKKTGKSVIAYSAPDEEHSQVRVIWLGKIKKFSELAKKLSPLLSAKTRDEQKISRFLQECIVLLRALNNMDLSNDTAAIDIDEDEERDDARNARNLRNIMPPWILDVCQDVIKYDIGMKISRKEFKHVLKGIYPKCIWSI